MYRNEAVAFVTGLLSAAVYFVPTLIAKQRNTENLDAIFLIDLVFGWTVLGWIAALIWAIYEKQKFKSSIKSHDAPTVAAQTEALPQAMQWGLRFRKGTDAGSPSSNSSAAARSLPACHSSSGRRAQRP